MIEVSAACTTALAQPSVKLRPRLLWRLQGGAIDITERMLGDWLPQVSRQVGAYLGPERTVPVVFTIQNEDNAFTPADVAGSLLANKSPDQYVGNRIEYSIGVQLATGDWEYVPSYVGVVADLAIEPGRVEITTQSLFEAARAREFPQEYVIRHTDYGPDVAGNVFGYFRDDWATYKHDSWDQAADLLASLDWNLSGSIRRGSRIGAAVEEAARSSCATILSTEDGKLAFLTEFPGISGSEGRFPSYVPWTIDRTQATDWRLSRPMELAAAEVIVQYQGVAVVWRSDDSDANIGRLARVVACSYAAFARQATLIARILYEQVAAYPLLVGFTMGPRGHLVQLCDRIMVNDPFTSTTRTYRVVVKDALLNAVHLEAVLDGHESTVVTNSTFAKWGTTIWDAAGEEFL